jgi:putative chitinase
MSQITTQLLREMVGIKAGRPLIDKLVDPLNLVLPAYGIVTEFRIAAFLATAAPESDWFKTLREYGKGAGRKYGKPHRLTGLIYYGRGIFQNTWYDGYKNFTEYVAEHWESIKPRALKYKYTVPPNFVDEPELLATPYWAVEAACWYWKVNGLAKYADRGLTGFFGLQGLVNRGNPEKKALQYDARLRSYETARRLIADDFELTSAAVPAAENRGSVIEPSAGASALDAGDPSSAAKPPISNENAAVGTVIEKEDAQPGFVKALWKKIVTFATTYLGLDQATAYAEKVQGLGLSPEFWRKVFYVGAAIVIAWILYEFYLYFICPWLKRRRTDNLIKANANMPGPTVVMPKDDLDRLEALGWTVVRRG